MKTNHNQTKRSLLCVLCASAVSFSALAANKPVTTGTVLESNQTYTDTATTAALTVSGSATRYSGSNITLNSTGSAAVSQDDTGKGAYIK
ncbi:MAG: hypothetical protein LBK60_02195, partial [Verrucomicrobiales bacterium]|nr:hypothetical protein [Verrucomicrobiales bacterium]